MERKFVVKIFDGTYSTLYSINGYDMQACEKKIIDFHTATGGKIVKVTTTEQRG